MILPLLVGIRRQAIECGLAFLVGPLIGVAGICVIHYCHGGSADPRCALGLHGWADYIVASNVRCEFDPELERLQRQGR